MKLCLTALEMKEADKFTIDNYYTSLELVAKAGEAIFSFLISKYDKNNNFIIFTGSGNNGGDGFALGTLLLNEGYEVDIFEVIEAKSKEAIYYKNKYKKDIITYFDKLNINDNTVIIDAIFGYGLNKDINEPYYSIINKINNSHYKDIVSIDIASGINATNGLIENIAIKADYTISLGELKLGLFLNDGKDYNKKCLRKDIDIKLNRPKNYYVQILEKEDFNKLFFSKDNLRKENSNKGCYGKVSLIGASINTPGALKLSELALSSLLLGSGYSEICYPKKIENFNDLTHPEIIYRPFKTKLNGSIKYNKKDLDYLIKTSKCITIGMGIGVSLDVYKIIKYLLVNYNGNLIIDADGLNSLSKYGVSILEEHKCNVILTPHIKEFSRLSNKTINEIKFNRINIAQEFVNKYDVILLLKDNSSLIISKDKKYLNINGNNGLAKGGSGDILSGIVAGALINKDNLVERVALASYILGRSADIAINKGINEYSLIGTEIIENINEVINELIGSNL